MLLVSIRPVRTEILTVSWTPTKTSKRATDQTLAKLDTRLMSFQTFHDSNQCIHYSVPAVLIAFC